MNKSKEVLAKVSVAAVKEKSEGFDEFLDQCLSEGASLARRFSRTRGQEEPALGVERGPDGLELIEPRQIMQQKAERWSTLWQGAMGPPKQVCPERLRALNAGQGGLDRLIVARVDD